MQRVQQTSDPVREREPTRGGADHGGLLCPPVSHPLLPTSLDFTLGRALRERRFRGTERGPWVSSIADNLPVATRLELYSNRDGDDKKKEKDVQFEHGYRLGFMDVNKVECPGVPRGLEKPQPKSRGNI